MHHNIIEHIVEFNKLYLVWQDVSTHSGTRYVVGEITRSKKFDIEDIELHYLKESPAFQQAIKLGFEGYPAFRIDKSIYNIGVLDAFMRRLPPRTRGDFPQYLETLRLPPNVEISDFALLGYSGAKLPSDSFQVIPSFEDVETDCEFLIEVAGFRHLSTLSLDQIMTGASVHFELEPENQFDTKAIRILLGDNIIGYVTKALLPAFHRWFNEGWQINAVIERKTDQSGGPLLYLFVSVSSQ